jgi:hypothetical protein
MRNLSGMKVAIHPNAKRCAENADCCKENQRSEPKKGAFAFSNYRSFPDLHSFPVQET